MQRETKEKFAKKRTVDEENSQFGFGMSRRNRFQRMKRKETIDDLSCKR